MVILLLEVREFFCRERKRRSVVIVVLRRCFCILGSRLLVCRCFFRIGILGLSGLKILKSERALRIDRDICLLFIFKYEGLFAGRVLLVILQDVAGLDRALLTIQAGDIGTPAILVKIEVSLFEIFADLIVVIDALVGQPAVDRRVVLGQIQDTDRVVELLGKMVRRRSP